MNFIKTDILSQASKEAVLRLWNNEYPKMLALNSTEELDDFLNEFNSKCYMFVSDEKHGIIAWLVCFLRDKERWFSIIVDGKFIGAGLGSKLLKKAMSKYDELNGWVIDHNNEVKLNGEPYVSPLPFYLKHKFELLSENRLEKENISAVKVKWVKQVESHNVRTLYASCDNPLIHMM